jgi:hypothetical protein
MAGNPRGLATKLLSRDPGARVGGDTIVGLTRGEQLFGVPKRPNFIVALGDRETIRGGRTDDELGALGRADTIIVNGSHELVIGGPGGKIVANGQGHDLLIQTKNDGMVLVHSPADAVVVSGQDNRIVCGRHVDVTVYKRKSDSVSHSCLGGHSRVLPISRAPGGTHFPSAAADAAAHAASVTGDGTNDSPFSTTCVVKPSGLCELTFPVRRLKGFWSNEYIPAYTCGSIYPYLVNISYALWGTRLPRGVEISTVNMGVSIVGYAYRKIGDKVYLTGTRTGGVASSATNWDTDASYKVRLHCTNDIRRAATGKTSGVL